MEFEGRLKPQRPSESYLQSTEPQIVGKEQPLEQDTESEIPRWEKWPTAEGLRKARAELGDAEEQLKEAYRRIPPASWKSLHTPLREGAQQNPEDNTEQTLPRIPTSEEYRNARQSAEQTKDQLARAKREISPGRAHNIPYKRGSEPTEKPEKKERVSKVGLLEPIGSLRIDNLPHDEDCMIALARTRRDLPFADESREKIPYFLRKNKDE